LPLWLRCNEDLLDERSRGQPRHPPLRIALSGEAAAFLDQRFTVPEDAAQHVLKSCAIPPANARRLPSLGLPKTLLEPARFSASASLRW